MVRQCALAILLAGTAVMPAAAQGNAEDPAPEIIADQVRAQGHACERAVTATKDADASEPGEPVWILRCGNATYRVRLIPDMLSRIERIE